MSDTWLVKFASRQPTAAVQFKQQVEAMSLDELRDFVGPSSTTSTIDSFMDKAAAAIQQGKQLAHEYGNDLIEKAAQSAAIDQSIVDAVSNLSDDQAIKLAEMLENGTDVEKIAGVMGMAGGALKTLGGMAFKHPHLTAAAGGAALGAAAGGPGNRLSGALVGGAAGGAASKALPGVANKIQQGGFGAALKGQQLMGKSAQQEINALYKTAMAIKCAPGSDGDFNWLSQFEGSPLLSQAIQLAEHEVQVEIESIQKRQERAAMMKQDSFEEEWTKRDIIRAQKHLLELQLIAQRNGLGAAAQPDSNSPPPQPNPQAQPQQSAQGVGGPGGTQLPMGQEKQAMEYTHLSRLVNSGAAKASPERLGKFLNKMHHGEMLARLNKSPLNHAAGYRSAENIANNVVFKRFAEQENLINQMHADKQLASMAAPKPVTTATSPISNKALLGTAIPAAAVGVGGGIALGKGKQAALTKQAINPMLGSALMVGGAGAALGAGLGAAGDPKVTNRSRAKNALVGAALIGIPSAIGGAVLGHGENALRAAEYDNWRMGYLEELGARMNARDAPAVKPKKMFKAMDMVDPVDDVPLSQKGDWPSPPLTHRR